MRERKPETASGGSRTDPSGEATISATALTEGGASLFTDQSVPIRSRGSDINKKRVREKQPPKPEFPEFPILPAPGDLSPECIEALTKRMNSARRSAIAFKQESERADRLARHYCKCADDIAVLLWKPV